MHFRDIPGQEEIKKSLIHSIKEGRISHAQMFYGPEGCGNLALALAYAQYVSCTNPKDEDSCGICPSCIKYNKLVHPDLHFSFPANAKENEKNPEDTLAKFREALLDNPFMNQFFWYEKIGMENKQGLISAKESHEIIRKLSLKSYESDYKVLIMWLPERMNATSANRLLKLIEEPPSGTLFLLVSETPEDVLQTIRSRTQMIKISKIPDEHIRFALSQKFDLPAEQLEDAVRLSNGNFFKAISTVSADQQNRYNFEKFISLMRLCYKKDVVELMNWSDEIAGIGREKQKMFLTYAIRLIRENFLLNIGKTEITHMAGYEDEFSGKFSRFIHDRNVEKIYEELNLAHNHISANLYARIVFLDLSLKIISLLHI
jgi:DNA polymerase-3 subunit delta'